MLLDIAKESTDVFPPLKSCLGGVNALIKHYEVRRCQTIPDSTNGRKPEPAIQRCERQAQRPDPVVGEVAGNLGEGEPGRRSRRVRETIKTGRVCPASGIPGPLRTDPLLEGSGGN